MLNNLICFIIMLSCFRVLKVESSHLSTHTLTLHTLHTLTLTHTHTHTHTLHSHYTHRKESLRVLRKMCRYLTREWLAELCEEVPTDPQRPPFIASISEVLAAVLENEVCSATLTYISYLHMHMRTHTHTHTLSFMVSRDQLTKLSVNIHITTVFLTYTHTLSFPTFIGYILPLLLRMTPRVILLPCTSSWTSSPNTLLPSRTSLPDSDCSSRSRLSLDLRPRGSHLSTRPPHQVRLRDQRERGR